MSKQPTAPSERRQSQQAFSAVDQALRTHGNLTLQHNGFGDYSVGLYDLSKRAALSIDDRGDHYLLLAVSKREGWDFTVSVDKVTGELKNPMQGEFEPEVIINDIAALEPALDAMLRDAMQREHATSSLRVLYAVSIPPPSGGGELTLQLLDDVVTRTDSGRGGQPVVKSRKLSGATVRAFAEMLKAMAPWQPQEGPGPPDSWRPQIEIQVSNVCVAFSRFESGETSPTSQLHAALAHLCDRGTLPKAAARQR
jgi:hypothetical protein